MHTYCHWPFFMDFQEESLAKHAATNICGTIKRLVHLLHACRHVFANAGSKVATAVCWSPAKWVNPSNPDVGMLGNPPKMSWQVWWMESFDNGGCVQPGPNPQLSAVFFGLCTFRIVFVVSWLFSHCWWLLLGNITPFLMSKCKPQIHTCNLNYSPFDCARSSPKKCRFNLTFEETKTGLLGSHHYPRPFLLIACSLVTS